MTTTRKPDGYCAWHRDKGWGLGSIEKCVSNLTPEQSQQRTLETACHLLGYYFDNDGFCHGEIDQEDFYKDGWQIKPVCLISPERLEELEQVEEKHTAIKKWFKEKWFQTFREDWPGDIEE